MKEAEENEPKISLGNKKLVITVLIILNKDGL